MSLLKSKMRKLAVVVLFRYTLNWKYCFGQKYTRFGQNYSFWANYSFWTKLFILDNSIRLRSDVSTGGGGKGQSATPDSENFAKNPEKRGKNQKKSGKRRKNWEEKAKIGKVLSLCPSWQLRLTLLLRLRQNFMFSKI